MSTRAESFSAAPSAGSSASVSPNLPLAIGVIGWLIPVVGLLAENRAAGLGLLTGLMFWSGITIGMLFLIMLTYIFDAGWAVVVRRQLEHGVSAFKWLALLFLPLVIVTFVHRGLLWPWMDPASAVPGHPHETVGNDVLWVKKSGYLNHTFFVVRYVLCFGAWILLAAIFRRNSFNQDKDGDAKWTLSSRKWAAGGLAIAAITATMAAIDWAKSLEYHWFSTMYGVWYFANSMRGALAVLAVIVVVGLSRGVFRGIIARAHLHDIGKLSFAFTVFWAYISFSQYFLIWNANVPEETFWYNIREHGDWWYVGLFLVFGHFVVPFLFLLWYKIKVVPNYLRAILLWVLGVSFIDICYNILPALKDANGEPLHFFSGNLLWALSSLIGVGGVWVWSYLRSFPTTKLIPIHDPRIEESLHHKE